jgi:translation initiation factor 2-alpha kinase 4
MTPAEDMTYDLGLGKSSVPSWAIRAARNAVERIFECHGASKLNTPLLMPRSSVTPPTRESVAAVAVMTHSGSIVTLPHDLRVPFARYVAWNGITSLKRFTVERVFRERRVFGLHPKELYECAFDIVSPTG